MAFQGTSQLSNVRRRGLLSTSAAALASLAIAGTTLAATWSAQAEVSAADISYSPDLITLSSTIVVATWVEDGTPDQIYVRRSINGGVTWQPPTHLGAGSSPALAGYGNDVDLVYNTTGGRVRYAHSDDGGQTFDPSKLLSPKGRYAWRPEVARGADGTVVVVYEDVVNGNVAARVSTNGGATFAAADILTGDGDEWGVAAAVGDGVIYVGYSVVSDRFRLRRSLNDGATWSSPLIVTNALSLDGLSMTAVGDHAYIAWTGDNSSPGQFFQALYRRTVNSGMSWSAPLDLSPDTWTGHSPDVGLAGGVLRAAFTRCTPEFDICESDRVYYRQSTTGTSWGSLLRVSPTALWYAYDPAVGSHRGVVAYSGENDTCLCVYARTRVASP